MKFIEARIVRQAIARVNRSWRRSGYQLKLPTLARMDDFGWMLTSHRHGVNRRARRFLATGISTLNAQVMALASLYRHFELMSERRERVLPANWTRPGGRPDPDFVLRNRIVQTINHSLAISRLFEDGLNNSARALARVNHEACLQTVVLCADRNVMIEHCSAHTAEEALRVWYRHFTKKKLARQVHGIGRAIEQQLGAKRKRKADKDRVDSDPVFEWFSDAVHSSFMASNVGAYATDADTGKVVSVLYGEADADADAALFAVNGSLVHSTALLFAVLVLRHGLSVEPTSRPLVSFKATQTAVRKVLLERGLGRRA